jgi:hypothetical protein
MLVKLNESIAERRRIYFDLRDATDGVTPVLTEAGGQPQANINGTGWFGSTLIGTLTHMGNGRYYADLTATGVATYGQVQTRYKSAATVESPGETATVVGFDPYNVEISLTGQAGTVEFTYIVYKTDGYTPLEGAAVWVSVNEDGTERSEVKVSDALGRVKFNLYPGTYYFWRQKSGYAFDNPDGEEVS